MSIKDQEPPLGEQELAPSSVVFKCRKDRLMSLQKLDVEKQIIEQGCPMGGRIETVDVNCMGKLEETAARAFSEECGICGLEPTEYDFSIYTKKNR